MSKLLKGFFLADTAESAICMVIILTFGSLAILGFWFSPPTIIDLSMNTVYLLIAWAETFKYIKEMVTNRKWFAFRFFEFFLVVIVFIVQFFTTAITPSFAVFPLIVIWCNLVLTSKEYYNYKKQSEAQ